MSEEKTEGLRPSVYAALVLAFASLGDAFLYAFLPVNFKDVHVPVLWVGALLSINRIVRIISNGIVVHAFSKFGLRTLIIVAMVMAILSTFGYGIAGGMAIWLFLRVVWGLSFSILRIGSLAYALQGNRRGISVGMGRSIQEGGPMLSLLLAPFLLQHADPYIVFFVLAIISVPGLYFAINLPRGNVRSVPVTTGWLLQWPSTLNTVTLVSSIVIDGIMVVVLGILFLQDDNRIGLVAATGMAGLYLSYRRFCLVALSTAGGWLADKIGISIVLDFSLSAVVLGLMLIGLGWLAIGAVIVFTFYSISSAITPGAVSRSADNGLAAVAENATWRDLGSALGTVLGGLLISSSYLSLVFQGSIVFMAATVALHIGTSRARLKTFQLWK